jgi:ABC-type multidrug transport system ATPase subunit
VLKKNGQSKKLSGLSDDLTVEEHLLFYARVKGVKPQDEEANVNKALKEVQLEQMRTL